jgi:hypothetical protein
MSDKELMNKQSTDVVGEGTFDGYKTGFEETCSDTFKTPFLKILQAMSPECKKGGVDYIEGAEQGLFCNTASKKVMEELDIIVLKIQHNLVVWKPERGGFVGVFDKAMENEIVVRQEGMKKYDKEGNEVCDTISLFCINANDYSDICVYPMSNASMKHAKTFATRMRQLKLNNNKLAGVTFAGVWNIKTVLEENNKGSWYSIGGTPSFKRFITKDEFENLVKPSLEKIEKAETDYSQMESKVTEEINY